MPPCTQHTCVVRSRRVLPIVHCWDQGSNTCSGLSHLHMLPVPSLEPQERDGAASPTQVTKRRSGRAIRLSDHGSLTRPWILCQCHHTCSCAFTPGHRELSAGIRPPPSISSLNLSFPFFLTK